MKFQQSTSLIKPWQVKYLVILITVFLFILTGCTKTDYPRPTREYCVNDFADILHPVTRDYILNEAENMYDILKIFLITEGLKWCSQRLLWKTRKMFFPMV